MFALSDDAIRHPHLPNLVHLFGGRMAIFFPPKTAVPSARSFIKMNVIRPSHVYPLLCKASPDMLLVK